MPAPFPRWSNAVLRQGIVAASVLLLAAVGAPMLWVRTPWASGQYRLLEQPVEFDHRHHVVDDGIDCRYCHDLVERSAYAGVPPAERCMNCHGQIWNESAVLAPVRASFFDDRPIAWQRVHRLPDFVFFDHSAHVGHGVGCEECHGRVDTMARVYQVAPLTMGWCLDCHRDPAPHLRPRELVTVMGWSPDRPRAELGRELMRQYDVRSLTSCTTCHR
jgi:hypothetical protein